ncbi:MAG TPA: GAF domain-containing protein, partial [Flavobacteriaceae bacterium]|nr:GAF domain-containing protein [Flavobacteriaceae bacterium]
AVLEIAEQYPILEKGITTKAQFEKYDEQIDIVLDELFSSILQENEIKLATVPFQEFVFKSSKRYKNIIAAAGEEFIPQLANFDDDYTYIMSCSIILNVHYGYNVDFKRPLHYTIPDADGVNHTYRTLYNGDFVDLIPTDKAVDITDADVEELLDGFDNIALWKEKFPPGSWIFKGFVIANMFDVTLDASISDFKSNLLRNNPETEDNTKTFESIFKSIFQLQELKIGFSEFNEEDQLFEKFIFKNIDSFILNEKDKQNCQTALCDASS